MKIFICYAKEDFSHAKRLYRSLSDEGFDPWIDEEKLNPGEYWKPKIARVINASDYFLLLLSKNSINKKGFIQKEIKIALDIIDEMPPYKIFIIPVLIDDCEPLHERIKEIQWTKLYPAYNNAFSKICSVIDPKRNERLKHHDQIKKVFEDTSELEGLKLYYRGEYSKKLKSFPELPLSALSAIYSVIVDLRVSLYRRNFLKTLKAPGCVISLGQITIEQHELKRLTAYIGNLLLNKGFNPTICDSGYSSGETTKTTVVYGSNIILDGSNKNLNEDVNYFYNNCPGVNLVAGADRFSSCEKAYGLLGSNLFILNDGFQHLKLHRDVNIAVISDLNPFGGGKLIPRGSSQRKT